ncbi:hypothetical protein DFJ73DRAFT_190499 [Zopfochytrium polystomum]|nr:hypothetical protein DFJ73DRAFT_190499 [Zopfochytrium polystomum]
MSGDRRAHVSSSPMRVESKSDLGVQTEDAWHPDGALNSRIAELESEIIKLDGDLKATLYRQREVGMNASEAIRQAETQRDSLKESLERQSTHVADLQLAKIELHNRVATLEQDVTFHQKLSDDLKRKLAIKEADFEKQELEGRHLKAKIEVMESEKNNLDQSLADMKRECQLQVEKIKTYKGMLSQLDSDRDKVRNEMDERAVTITRMKEQISKLETSLFKCQEDLQRSHAQIDQLSQNSNEQDAEISGLHRQCRILSDEREHYLGEWNVRPIFFQGLFIVFSFSILSNVRQHREAWRTSKILVKTSLPFRKNARP